MRRRSLPARASCPAWGTRSALRRRRLPTTSSTPMGREVILAHDANDMKHLCTQARLAASLTSSKHTIGRLIREASECMGSLPFGGPRMASTQSVAQSSTPVHMVARRATSCDTLCPVGIQNIIGPVVSGVRGRKLGPGLWETRVYSRESTATATVE